MSGFVYYIACAETMRLKIGFTKSNPLGRMKSLQTGSPTQLVLMACHPGSPDVERELHERFSKQRVRGEWFQMDAELFEHVSLVTWLSAVDCRERGAALPPWVEIGLRSMHEDSPLPPDLAELIE